MTSPQFFNSYRHSSSATALLLGSAPNPTLSCLDQLRKLLVSTVYRSSWHISAVNWGIVQPRKDAPIRPNPSSETHSGCVGSELVYASARFRGLAALMRAIYDNTDYTTRNSADVELDRTITYPRREGGCKKSGRRTKQLNLKPLSPRMPVVQNRISGGVHCS
jgi:hypothetical protein